MSKKILLFIPVSKGGLMPDPIEKPTKVIENLPLHKELPKDFKKILPKVHVLRSDQDIDNDGLADTIEYMTVSDYASYIDRPIIVVYRMVRENELESIKLKNKLHIVLRG